MDVNTDGAVWRGFSSSEGRKTFGRTESLEALSTRRATMEGFEIGPKTLNGARLLRKGVVKRYLRDVKTMAYYSYGKWTQDAHLAQEFPDAMSAVAISVRENAQDLEIVLQMGEEPSTKYDVRLPLVQIRRQLGLDATS
jgi:hypothetical protein